MSMIPGTHSTFGGCGRGEGRAAPLLALCRVPRRVRVVWSRIQGRGPKGGRHVLQKSGNSLSGSLWLWLWLWESKAKQHGHELLPFPGISPPTHLQTNTSTTTASLTPPPAICLPPATDDEQRRPSLRTRKGLGLLPFASLFCL